MPVTPIASDQIVITASRASQEEAQTPASVTVVDARRIARLGEPLVPALLRLVPSAAVATSGPGGSLTEVRIRGAEANHTLLFIDGIAANDPASGDTPRFELLNADLASRIEVVRGPQSALWGSDAIGGVVAVNGVDEAPAYAVAAEAGSFGFRRASASGALQTGDASLAGGIGWQRAAGIDSFDGHGDKDGYRNLSGRVRGTWTVAPAVELGVAALALTGRSEFDGFSPDFPFPHADTLDSSRNRLAAGSLLALLGRDAARCSGRLAASALGSTNRNLLAADEINRTRGTRRTLGAQLERGFATGLVAHRLIGAVDAEWEGFHARDFSGGFTNQDRTRQHQALTLEWRGEAKAVIGGVAVRHDVFNRFKDASSLRLSLLAPIAAGFSVAGSYADGIAQPTFFDLYGFFPGSFIGNPSLKPESSRGFEASLRYLRGSIEAALTGYRQRLHNEIVPTADFTSTVNREDVSRRSGVEAEFGWKIGEAARLTANYAYLRATQPLDSGGASTELRRPKHSGSVALDGATGRVSYGASLAYVGAHLDQRDVAPFDVARLDAYWLAGARVAYAVRPGLELFGRASNLFDSRYQDVSGYRTEGRGVYAGVRLASRP